MDCRLMAEILRHDADSLFFVTVHQKHHMCMLTRSKTPEEIFYVYCQLNNKPNFQIGVIRSPGSMLLQSPVVTVCTFTSASSTILLPSGQMTWSTWERTLSQVSSGVRRLAYRKSRQHHQEPLVFPLILSAGLRCPLSIIITTTTTTTPGSVRSAFSTTQILEERSENFRYCLNYFLPRPFRLMFKKQNQA